MTRSAGVCASLDVYLQPAVVGGGLGDIEEVLAVGRRLERLGCKPFLYRRSGRPLPASVQGPWGWPPIRRVRQVVPQSPKALTVTPWWGVSAVPDAERSGRPGPWSLETADLEAAYGRDQVVHLSLEEFARTLTSREQTRERWREGGVGVREISRRLSGRAAARDIRTFHEAYRKWRAFNRQNVLHLFSGFRPSRSFGQEFPEAIQAGPVWPERHGTIRRRSRSHRWVWYASPATSERLATLLARALPPAAPGRPRVQIDVRSPRRFNLPLATGVRWRWVLPSLPGNWSRRFQSADLRVVTGSRTMIEAIANGGPFLYFNGVLNEGRRTRRHRPEKIAALLDAWRRHGVPRALRNDLAEFSRLRRVDSIVRKVVQDPGWSARFPARAAAVDYDPPWDDGGRLIDRWVSEWAASGASSSVFVRRIRGSQWPPRSRL